MHSIRHTVFTPLSFLCCSAVIFLCKYASSIEGKKASVELEKTEEEFLEFLMSLYPRHQNKVIHVLKVTRQRTLDRVVPATPATLRAANYQGTGIVKELMCYDLY
jgi:hypothetical protein